MSPGSNDSPLETLRQLREMLDAGTLSQPEFEALKQQLVFRPVAPEPPVPAAPPIPAVPSAIAPQLAAEDESNYPPDEPRELRPAAAPSAFVVDSYEAAATPPPANYLNLILSIGGLLLLFGLVLYLAANRHPSEHIDSSSLLASDSVAVVEVGPQAAPLPAVPVAAPETVRLAPANPAPPVRYPSRPAADSAATPAADSDTAAAEGNSR